MLKRLTIKKISLLALVVLSLLVSLSSFVAWKSFSHIQQRQNSLLTSALPAMGFVNQVINEGGDLLDLGTRLDRPLQKNELAIIRREAASVFRRVESDMALLEQQVSVIDAPSDIQSKIDSVVDNVKQQLALQFSIVSEVDEFRAQRRHLQEQIDAALVVVKLQMTALINLRATTNTRTEYWQNQQALMTEYRFQLQQLKTTVDQLRLSANDDFFRASENTYRHQMKKLTSLLVRMDSRYQQVLANSLGPLQTVLQGDDNLFMLAQQVVSGYANIADIQDKTIALNQSLSAQYAELSRQASDQLNQSANEMLAVVDHAKRVILFSSLIFLLSVIALYYIFIRPRLVNRLVSLASATEAIANNHYNVVIDRQGSDEIADMAKSLDYFRDQLMEKDTVQKRLMDSEKNLSTIFSNAAEGLFTVDIHGVLQTCNEAFKRIVGADCDLKGTTINTFFPGEVSLFSAHRQRSAPLEGRGYTVCQDQTVFGQTLHDEPFTASLSVTLLNLSGRHVYSGFARDITEETITREKMDILVDKLTQSNAELERFAYSCSHDLQEPVRTVLNFAELLQSRQGQELGEDGQRYLQHILKSAQTARQLIRDILDYSRVEQVLPSKSWCTVNTLAESVAAITSVTLAEVDGEFGWDSGELRLFVVEPQLVQVLTNLVVNGLKYNESSSPQVHLAAVEREDNWELVVSDNGIGIDPRYHEKIFEIFSRLVGRRDYPGSGIGLATCKKIIERHGGQITVESAHGQGSRFTLFLPKP